MSFVVLLSDLIILEYSFIQFQVAASALNNSQDYIVLSWPLIAYLLVPFIA